MHPQLSSLTRNGVTLRTDTDLFATTSIAIGFSERTGGVSLPPYASLNCGLHVGDDPRHVATNRMRVLQALNLSEQAQLRLVGAHQVHGVAIVDIKESGDVVPAVKEGTDALITALPQTPLMLCFADCVPVIIVSPETPRVVAVVHSGWRGTLAEISGLVAENMVATYGCDPTALLVYIGPYIGPQNFEVSAEVASQFAAKFVTLKDVACPQEEAVHDGSPARERVSHNECEKQPRATYRFDLGEAVRESLVKRGVKPCNIVSLDECSVESTERFYSYRAENGVTGRHCAVACIAD